MAEFERTERTLRTVADALNEIFNPDETSQRTVGFVLLTFDMGEMKEGEGRANYISNGADRADIVILFKEMIARFEGQPEAAGHG